MWEVHGVFSFSPDGVRIDHVIGTVFVTAEDAPSAARAAIENLGCTATIEKVYQVGYGQVEAEE
jgi:hypothetical protein